jgi:hypothetical protein
MAAALLCIGCAPAEPAPRQWAALAEWRGAAISYDPASVRRRDDEVVEATIALDYPQAQQFQRVAYTRSEMRVHVDCLRRLVGSTDFSLFADGRRIRTGRSTAEWHPLRDEESAEWAWAPALCRKVEPPVTG